MRDNANKLKIIENKNHINILICFLFVELDQKNKKIILDFPFA